MCIISYIHVPTYTQYVLILYPICYLLIYLSIYPSIDLIFLSLKELSPHSNRQQKRVSRPQPPAFMQLYSSPGAPTTAIPVVYHPHTTTLVDPYSTGYYNHHMVLYPVSPQATG